MPKRAITDASTAAGAKRPSAEPLSHPIPALTIVSHPMAHRAGERCLLRGLAAGKEMALARNGPDFVKPGSGLGEPLANPFVSRKPIRLALVAEGRIRI